MRLSHFWQIKDLYVLQTHRRLGVGRALLDLVRATAIEAGALRLVLQTEDDNDAALRLYADSGYAGPMVETACQALGGCQLVTIAKDAAAHGFHVLPKRWVVERTLAWICRNRRLAKDYEHLTAVSEAFVKLAMIRLMTARLT